MLGSFGIARLAVVSVNLLKNDRAGQYAIRINDQFRVCFRWRGGEAYEVEITDYH